MKISTPMIPRREYAAVAQETGSQPVKPASPEEIDQMLEFVNQVREIRGLGSIAALPEATGNLASERPLSLAIGASVIKHKDNGPFYCLVYKKETMNALIKCGCSTMTAIPRIMSDETTMMWELRLPEYLKPFA
jgi:hypothetical protein